MIEGYLQVRDYNEPHQWFQVMVKGGTGFYSAGELIFKGEPMAPRQRECYGKIYSGPGDDCGTVAGLQSWITSFEL